MTPGQALTQTSAAVDGRLKAHNVRVAGALSTTYPYATTYVSSPVPLDSDMGDSQRRVTFQINTVVVGETKEQCEALLARVVTAFHRWRPEVGAASHRIRHQAGMPPAFDDDLPDRRVWTARDAWSLTISL